MARLPSFSAPALSVLLLPACVLPLASAPAPAPGASPAGPIDVVVRLDPADRELLAGLLARGTPAPAPEVAPLHPSPRAVRERSPFPPRSKRRVVEDGPVLQASYDSGGPLYEGAQVQVDGRWLRHGAWRAWHTNGQLWEEGAYFRGEEHGAWSWWYENGQIQATGTFEHGQHVGEWVFYFENGQVLAAGRYEADRPVGRWRTHAQDGTLLSEGDYEGGQRVGHWLFQEVSGAADLERSGRYEGGVRVGD